MFRILSEAASIRDEILLDCQEGENFCKCLLREIIRNVKLIISLLAPGSRLIAANDAETIFTLNLV